MQYIYITYIIYIIILNTIAIELYPFSTHTNCTRKQQQQDVNWMIKFILERLQEGGMWCRLVWEEMQNIWWRIRPYCFSKCLQVETRHGTLYCVATLPFHFLFFFFLFCHAEFIPCRFPSLVLVQRFIFFPGLMCCFHIARGRETTVVQHEYSLSTPRMQGEMSTLRQLAVDALLGTWDLSPPVSLQELAWSRRLPFGAGCCFIYLKAQVTFLEERHTKSPL